MRLELSPSDAEARNFFQHINQLGRTDSFTVDVPAEMLERVVNPDEGGTREHEIACLPQTCVNLKFALEYDDRQRPTIKALSMEHDSSYSVSANSDTGFRPTPRVP